MYTVYHCEIPSIIMVHNAEYQGQQNMDQAELLPPFIPENYGSRNGRID